MMMRDSIFVLLTSSLVLLSSSISFASCYVVDEKKIECSEGFTPNGVLLPIPLDDDGKMVTRVEDLDFEDIIEDGKTKRRAIFSQTKRDARIQAEAQALSDAEVHATKMNALKGQLRAAIVTLGTANEAAQKKILENILRFLTEEVE